VSASAADQLAAQGASPEEAAAIVAAIERFARDTAAPARRSPPGDGDRWLRAARLESVGGSPDELGPWGDPHPWEG
jgi:hypothetical protein